MPSDNKTATPKKKAPTKAAASAEPKADAKPKAVRRPAAKTKATEPAPEAAPVTAPAKAAVPAAPAPEPTPAPVTPATPPAPAAPAAAPVVAGPPADGIVHMKPPIVVMELAVKMGLKPFQLVHHLMELGVFKGSKDTVDEEQARKVCEKCGLKFEVEKRVKEHAQVHAPIPVVEPPKPEPVKVDKLQFRPPVVTIMGHVDHGKTSLLDAIRSTRVAAGEAGGITQHIGAYTVKRDNHSITFLDTPGHEAFTAMRARGANCTDIVILVVASDDGLMPQTLEAIAHARAAKVPIIVAINKCDLPGANPMRVKGQLQEQGLVPEEYGGDTICVEVSATKKIGIEKLLELMLLQSEVMELKADPAGLATGSIIEAQFEQGRGPTATILVKSGTLRVGDSMIVGPHYGRIRALINDVGANVKEAGPSMPVKVLGLDGCPVPGEEFIVMKNERDARTIAEERKEKQRLGKLTGGSKVTLENLFSTINDADHKVLNLVLKADVQGSCEALVGQLKKISSKKIDLNIVHSAVGSITESDILLARASGAIVIGFNTKTENSAAQAAKREDIQIKLYSIIYELIDQVKEAMAGLLDPENRESVIGTALVKQVFALTKYPVAGCAVQTGRVVRNAHARVLRKRQPIYDGTVQTLKRFQDDASEVRAGMECGIRLGDFNEYQVDDIIEVYQLEKVAQAL